MDAAPFLEDLSRLATEAGRDLIAQDAASLLERLRLSVFYVACVGQFKRGKSTVLDAMLGESILPVGVVPVTAVPTVVRYGPARSAKIHLKNGASRPIRIDEVESYISEVENPGNAKLVQAVEIFLPNDLLAHGVCLVDTPGLGSVFDLNTAATQQFVPHIDAAIVVLGADPPISGDELELVTRLSHHVEDLIFVLNKADRIPATDLAEAREFGANILRQRLGKPVTILEVAAKEQLESHTEERDWPLLLNAITRLESSSRERLVNAAAQRGTTRLAKALDESLIDEYETLTGPIETLEHRERQLDEAVSKTEEILLDLTTLMNAEQRRAMQSIGKRRQEWLQSAETAARAELNGTVIANPVWGPSVRRTLFERTQELSERLVGAWLSTQEENMEVDYHRIRTRFIASAKELLLRLADSGVEGVDRAVDALQASPDLSTQSRFHFTSAMSVARPASPFRYLADVMLGLTGQQKAIRKDANDFLIYLLDTNSSRAQRDLDDRLTATRSDLEQLIRKTLSDSIESARAALNKTRTTRRNGEDAIASEVEQLKSWEQRLMHLVETHGLEQPLT